MPLWLMYASTASFLTLALTISTHRLPTVTARLQNAMMMPFIDGGAWL